MSLEKLKSILNKGIFSKKNSVGSVTLKESGHNSDIKELVIKNLPSDSFVFTLDHKDPQCSHFDQLSIYLNKNDAKINKSCDFVIAYISNSKIRILIGDIKSKKLDKTKIRCQLLNSKVFLEYLISLLRNHNADNQGNLYVFDVEFEYVIVHTQVANLLIKTPVSQVNRKYYRPTHENLGEVLLLPVTVVQDRAEIFFQQMV